jgi:hypothetical protein
VKPSKEKQNISRRNVLRSFGVAAGIGGGVLSSARVSALDRERAKKRRRRIQRRAYRVLQESDSPEKRAEFLRDHGFKVGLVQETYSMPTGEKSDGVEPMAIEKNDLDIYMTIESEECDVDEYDCSEVQVNMGFQYEMDYGNYGEPPRDVATFGWDDISWDKSPDNDNDAATYAVGPTTIEYTDESLNTGMAFEVVDADLGGGTSDWYSCGVWLTPDRNSYPREVYGLFSHSWTSWNGYIKSISAGLPPNLTVTFGGFSVGWWDTAEDPRTNTPLHVEESDIY